MAQGQDCTVDSPKVPSERMQQLLRPACAVWVYTGHVERTLGDKSPGLLTNSITQQSQRVAADFRVDCSALKHLFNPDDLSKEQDYYHILIEHSNA
jgi:hypothetical protein